MNIRSQIIIHSMAAIEGLNEAIEVMATWRSEKPLVTCLTL